MEHNAENIRRTAVSGESEEQNLNKKSLNVEFPYFFNAS